MMKRWKLLDAQRAEMWNRWKAGLSLHEIGRAFGKGHNVIRFVPKEISHNRTVRPFSETHW